MTQSQIINMLDGIMPDIIKSRNPEQEMLKCAGKNNLSPAQLEKMAQVFNTMKTNVFLKQASDRGGSFSLVDPAAIVANYSTYSPEKELGESSKKVHETVNKIIKGAAGSTSLLSWRQRNMAWINGSDGDSTVQYRDTSSGNQRREESMDEGDSTYDIKFASAREEVKVELPTVYAYRAERDRLTQDMFDAREDLHEKLASVRSAFDRSGADWSESVEDIVDKYGDDGRRVVRLVEGYFNKTAFEFKKADLSKRAYSSPFVKDRNGVFGKVDEIICLLGAFDKAAAELEAVEKEAKKKKYTAGKDDEADAAAPMTDSKPSPEGADADMAPTDSAPATPPGADAALPIDNVLPTTVPSSPANVVDETGDAVTKALLEGVKSPFISSPKADYGTMVDYFKDMVTPAKTHNNGQAAIDAAVSKAKRETTLNQLLLSDPYISSQEPQKVKEIFDLIADHSPMFGESPRLMAPILKEALQFDSVTVPQLKDILMAQKTDLENQRLQKELSK